MSQVDGALIPFPVFLAIWMAYGLGGLPIYLGRNLRLKVRFAKPYTIGAGLLFIAGMAVTGFPWPMVALAAPFVVGITIINLRRLRFCSLCGTTVWNQLPFQKAGFCSKCGADFNVNAPTHAA